MTRHRCDDHHRHRSGRRWTLRLAPQRCSPMRAGGEGCLLSAGPAWGGRTGPFPCRCRRRHHRVYRSAVAPPAGPRPGVPTAELRPRIARFTPHLTRVLFMSRTVHSATSGKPAQLLGRAARKSGTRPVRSGALSGHPNVGSRETVGRGKNRSRGRPEKAGSGPPRGWVFRLVLDTTAMTTRQELPTRHQPANAASRRVVAPLKPGRDPLAPADLATISPRQ